MRLIWFLIIMLSSASAYAQQSFTGRVVAVLSPDTVRVSIGDKYQTDFTLVGPKFNSPAQHCMGGNAPGCDLLQKLVGDKEVGIVIDEVGYAMQTGDIIVDDKLLSVELVRQGHYRFDWQYSRAQHMVIAEREAYCHYRGLWARYRGQHEHALKCQSR